MKIEKTNQELTQPVQNRQSIAPKESTNEKLRETFTPAEVSKEVVETNNKPPKLDFSGFKKSYRQHANDFARRSLNEIIDTARSFNRDYPTTPYIIDYEAFPLPEDFDPKNFGGKDNAFESWKDAVVEWVENAKQDIEAARTKSAEEMYESTIETMTNGFYGVYMQMGLTREFIEATCKELSGDIKAVRARLDEAVKEINSNTNTQAAKTRRTVVAENVKTREEAHKDYSSLRKDVNIGNLETRNAIHDEHYKTRDTIINENHETREAVYGDGHETRNKIDDLVHETFPFLNPKHDPKHK